MKHLIGLIDKSKVERMYYIYQQGKVILALKKLAPKGCELWCYLHLHGIKYSDSYCRQLVLIHDLIDKHQNLLKRCLNVSTLVQRRKMIEEIYIELGL